MVQVDLDEEAIGAHRPVALGVVGDAAATAEALLAALAGRAAPAPRGARPRWRREIAAAALARRALRRERDGRRARPAHAQHRARRPAARTSARSSVDSGAFMGWPSMYLRVPDAAGFVFPQAFQCVGLALGNAIGAAIARPDRLTVAALGDGGALMSLPELETLGRLGLPMLVVIYDDAAYGAEVHHFAPMGEAVDLAQFPDTDFAALARAAGCHGLTARSLDDLGAPARVARRPRPALRARREGRSRRSAANGSRKRSDTDRGGRSRMPLLTDLVDALQSGAARVVDLTQPLSERTPVLVLPEPFANTPGLSRRELSRYDDRGPAWAWDVLEIGEHVGTHFDAPIHWITGRDGEDVASVPPARLVGPAVVIDKSAEAAQDPDYLLTVDQVRAFEAEHGALPEGAWLLLRTGWDARAHDQDAFLNVSDGQPHTPGIDAECARWLAQESPVVGVGVETVGTDAGAAGGFDPPFPVHHFVLGAGKYGLTQLANLAELPPVGAVIIVAPLKLAGRDRQPDAGAGARRRLARQQRRVVGARGEDPRQAAHAPALGALDPSRALGEVEGQLAAEPERVGDQVAVVERDGRPQLVADLG